MNFSTKRFCFSCKSPLLKHFPSKLWHNCVVLCVTRVRLAQRRPKNPEISLCTYGQSSVKSQRSSERSSTDLYHSCTNYRGGSTQEHSHAANTLMKRDFIVCSDVVCSSSPWQYILELFTEVGWNVPAWYQFSFPGKPRSCLHSKCHWEILLKQKEEPFAINRSL